MEVFFRTKEESKRAQEEEFLALSPNERFYAFLKLCYDLRNFPSKPDPDYHKGNFVLEKPKKT